MECGGRRICRGKLKRPPASSAPMSFPEGRGAQILIDSDVDGDDDDDDEDRKEEISRLACESGFMQLSRPSSILPAGSQQRSNGYCPVKHFVLHHRAAHQTTSKQYLHLASPLPLRFIPCTISRHLRFLSSTSPNFHCHVAASRLIPASALCLASPRSTE